MESKFVKMSDLVDKTFRVEKVWPYKWKFWDNVAKKMLVSDTYVDQHRKVYGVVTNLGTVDMSATSLGSMLEGVSKDGQSNIIGASFHVKSNGKAGMEIRYYINSAKPEPKPIDEEYPEAEQINLDDIPF